MTQQHIPLVKRRLPMLEHFMNYLTCPARVTNALVTEEPINTYSMFAGTGTTKVNLLMAALASESRGTCTAEICYQISAVSTQQARTF
jgi:hypothetical protein